jgi:phosphoglycolate phosphatase
VRAAYEHVVFDLDGTLIDSRVDIAAAMNHVLGTLGLPAIPQTTLTGYVGDGARALVERALGPAHQDFLPRALELFMARYGAHLLDTTRPYPGIPDALAAIARSGVALSVLTNKPVAMSRAILDGLGLAPHFVAVLGGDSLPVKKPDPAGVQHLRHLTGTAPERTLLVGDSAIDVRTARAAQSPSCGVTWGFNPDTLLAAKPDRVVEHPADLIEIVARG